MPGSEYVVIDNASHLSHAEQPESFNRVVRDFLKRSEAKALTRDR
jgi:pimeloyl-ACP methyl ester carboxylesterase